MRTRQLGNTNLSVTQLGYGSMGLRGPNTWGVRIVDETTAERFLNRVVDVGINFIDTAPDYGIAEERIGKYLSHRRREFYLATKCGCDYIQHADHIEIQHHFTADVVRRNLETSLKRLRTDYLDLLQFHGGNADELEQAGLIELVNEFRQAGKVRFIGISSSLPQLPALIEMGCFDTFQIPYSCVEPQHHDLITQAGEGGAGIIIRGGIGKGGPEAEIQREQLNAVWNEAKLDEFREEGTSPAELILRFTLSHPYCHTTIVGTCNEAHLHENLQAVEKGPLPQETSQAILQRVRLATQRLVS